MRPEKRSDSVLTYQAMTPGEVRDVAHAYFAERVGKTSAPEQPTFVLVGGQPGAGKSSAAQMVRDELAARGGFIHIDADRMRERIETHGTKPTSQETQADAGRLVTELRNETIAARRNALEEGTFRDTLAALTAVETRRAAGYRVEVVAVATPAAESLLGIYQRHEYQHAFGASNPRFVEKSYHDMAMAGFQRSLGLVEPLADRVRVITRDGEMLYDSAAPKNQHRSALDALRAGQELKPERVPEIQNGWALVSEMARGRNADPDYLAGIHDRASVSASAPYSPQVAPTAADAMRGKLHGLALPEKTSAEQAAAVLRLAQARGITPAPASRPAPTIEPDKTKDRGPER